MIDLKNAKFTPYQNSWKEKFEIKKKVLDFAEDEIATTRYFIGIPVPEQIASKFRNFQERFQEKTLPVLAESHITIKAPCGLLDNESWLNKTKDTLAALKPFKISLEGFETFNNTVLYLKAEPHQTFFDIHSAIVEQINYGPELRMKYFEKEHYIPHMTLIHKKIHMDNRIFSEIKELAINEFSDPMEFLVSLIVIYKQTSLSMPYERYVEIKLNK